VLQSLRQVLQSLCSPDRLEWDVVSGLHGFPKISRHPSVDLSLRWRSERSVDEGRMTSDRLLFWTHPGEGDVSAVGCFDDDPAVLLLLDLFRRENSVDD